MSPMKPHPNESLPKKLAWFTAEDATPTKMYAVVDRSMRTDHLFTPNEKPVCDMTTDQASDPWNVALSPSAETATDGPEFTQSQPKLGGADVRATQGVDHADTAHGGERECDSAVLGVVPSQPSYSATAACKGNAMERVRL